MIFTRTHFLQFQKWQKINFCTRKKFKTTKNAIFGLFSRAKIDFLPFLKMQKMFFCAFEIALFSNFRALCNCWCCCTIIPKRENTDGLQEQEIQKAFFSQLSMLTPRLKQSILYGIKTCCVVAPFWYYCFYSLFAKIYNLF